MKRNKNDALGESLIFGYKIQIKKVVFYILGMQSAFLGSYTMELIKIYSITKT